MNKKEFKNYVKCSGGKWNFVGEYERPKWKNGYYTKDEAEMCKRILEKITSKKQILYHISKESVYFREKRTDLITRLSNHWGEVGQSYWELDEADDFEHCFGRINVKDLDLTYDIKHLFKPIPNLTCKKCKSGKWNHCLLTDGTYDKVCTRCREQERE